MLKFLANTLWLLLGGIAIALEYFFAGILMSLTIVGIPFAKQLFKLGMFAIWPFSQSIKEVQEPDGCLTIPMNILWFILGGFWVIVTHVLFGTILFITIIGIPWGQQHFQMAHLAFAPFNKYVIPKK